MENYKIIFLDLDGVLNIAEGRFTTAVTKLDHFETNLISNFNEVLKLKNIKIVMSSSWREDYEDTIYLLSNLGLNIDNFIGQTIFDKNKDYFRGNEIRLWLNENKFKGKYLCIDDDMSGICGEFCNEINKEYCLKIDPKVGFSKDNINYVEEYFI